MQTSCPETLTLKKTKHAKKQRNLQLSKHLIFSLNVSIKNIFQKQVGATKIQNLRRQHHFYGSVKKALSTTQTSWKENLGHHKQRWLLSSRVAASES